MVPCNSSCKSVQHAAFRIVLTWSVHSQRSKTRVVDAALLGPIASAGFWVMSETSALELKFVLAQVVENASSEEQGGNTWNLEVATELPCAFGDGQQVDPE